MTHSIYQNCNGILAQQLTKALPKALHAHIAHISCCDTTGSTNDDAKALAIAGVDSAICMALNQSTGRGQHGRKWTSTTGNLFLSLLYPVNTPIQGAFALDVALAILDIPSLDATPLKIKWPNDIGVLDNGTFKKYGGILIEPINSHSIVIGIGLNIALAPTLVDNTKTGYVEQFTAPINLFELAADISWRVWQECQALPQQRTIRKSRFLTKDVMAMSQVSVTNTHNHTLICQGMALGIDDDGGLLIKTPSGVQCIYSGHVQLSENPPER